MNHYEILGVGESASGEEIRRAYKRLAKQYHPDANPDDPTAEDRFKEISAAYSILSDDQKRAQYDAERKMRASGGIPPGFGGFSGFGGFDPFSTFMGGDPFEIFREVGRNLSIHASLQIGFLDARDNQVRSIKFLRNTVCSKCAGSGAQSYHAASCPNCHGRGNIVRSIGGLLQASSICPSCKGKGKLVKAKCTSCNEGSVQETAEINVHIPAGIISGKTLRLQGEGHKSVDAKGDLLIKITIAPDERWSRDGANVHSKVMVSYPTLVLGGDIEVETIWGRERVKIPEKTKAGAKLGLNNKGFPRLGRILADERGTHYITLDLMIPDDNSKQHKDLLLNLQNLYQ